MKPANRLNQADRIAGILRKKGNQAGYKKVKRSMNEQKLYSVHLKYQRSQPSSRRARGDGYPNLLKNTEITKPLQALSGDISYIPTNEGFEYTCTIRDIMSGVVLSSKTTGNMKKELVPDTINSLQKSWHLPKEIIFHSDRGSQYTSSEVMKLLSKPGFR
ncbi:MAG: DDE-type integrase/transposase/recombinase [Flexilinea sp.]